LSGRCIGNHPKAIITRYSYSSCPGRLSGGLQSQEGPSDLLAVVSCKGLVISQPSCVGPRGSYRVTVFFTHLCLVCCSQSNVGFTEAVLTMPVTAKGCWVVIVRRTNEVGITAAERALGHGYSNLPQREHHSRCKPSWVTSRVNCQRCPRNTHSSSLSLSIITSPPTPAASLPKPQPGPRAR
jgi:hypothetical protein